MEENIKIVCVDGVNYTLNLGVAEKCGTLKNLIEDLGTVENIPINVKSNIFANIKNCLEAETDGNLLVFMKKYNNEALIEMIVASNYLDCKSVLDGACELIADQIRGKNENEIRELFNLEDDLTQAEKDEIAKELAITE